MAGTMGAGDNYEMDACGAKSEMGGDECERARQQNSESSGNSRENPSILKISNQAVSQNGRDPVFPLHVFL